MSLGCRIESVRVKRVKFFLINKRIFFTIMYWSVVHSGEQLL